VTGLFETQDTTTLMLLGCDIQSKTRGSTACEREGQELRMEEENRHYTPTVPV